MFLRGVTNMKNDSGKMLQRWLVVVSLLLVMVIVAQGLYWKGVLPRAQTKSIQTGDHGDFSAEGSLSRDGYQLEQVVVLSRHNIRSPLSGSGSVLGSITPHEWFAWSSNPSELSLRGGNRTVFPQMAGI